MPAKGSCISPKKKRRTVRYEQVYAIAYELARAARTLTIVMDRKRAGQKPKVEYTNCQKSIVFFGPKYLKADKALLSWIRDLNKKLSQELRGDPR